MGQAAAVDAQAGSELQQATTVAAPPAVVSGPNPAAMEWVFAPELAAMIITTLFPETLPIYTDDLNMRVAEKLAAVAEKRGWSGASSSPEIGLGIALVGFSMPAYMAYKARIAAAKAAEEARANGDRQ
jgi:hypothetical protein